jgi:hypothetical protein
MEEEQKQEKQEEAQTTAPQESAPAQPQESAPAEAQPDATGQEQVPELPDKPEASEGPAMESSAPEDQKTEGSEEKTEEASQ